MKKILLSFLALHMASAVSLVGCGDDGPNPALGPVGESEDAYKNLRSPERSEMQRIQSLALQLQMDTEEAYRRAYEAATAANRHISAQEQEALKKLYQLKVMAAEFNGSVDEYYENPVETRYYFYQLNRMFVEVQPRFVHLGVYVTIQPLFETIIDCFGNFRMYYVIPGYYAFMPVVDVYPYYPGHPRWNVFIGVGVIHDHFHFRHQRYWHLHIDHYKIYPARRTYIETRFSWYFSWSVSVQKYGWVGGQTHFHQPRPRYIGFNAEFGRHAHDLQPLLKNPQYRVRAEQLGTIQRRSTEGGGPQRPTVTSPGRVPPSGGTQQPGRVTPRPNPGTPPAPRPPVPGTASPRRPETGAPISRNQPGGLPPVAEPRQGNSGGGMSNNRTITPPSPPQAKPTHSAVARPNPPPRPVPGAVAPANQNPHSRPDMRGIDVNGSHRSSQQLPQRRKLPERD